MHVDMYRFSFDQELHITILLLPLSYVLYAVVLSSVHTFLIFNFIFLIKKTQKCNMTLGLTLGEECYEQTRLVRLHP